MADPKPGATQDAPPPSPEESAKLAESLKAAQDSAEAARKRSENLEASLEERDDKLAELEAKMKEFESSRPPNKVPKDPKSLAAMLRKQADDGDADAIGVLEAAREIAREEFGNASIEEKMQSSFDQQETFIAEKCRERGWTKAQFIEKLDEHAAPFTNRLPHIQAQLAYAALVRDEALATREAAIVAKEKELGTWKDPGTGQSGPESKPKSAAEKSWRDDKTDAERRNRLADL